MGTTLESKKGGPSLRPLSSTYRSVSTVDCEQPTAHPITRHIDTNTRTTYSVIRKLISSRFGACASLVQLRESHKSEPSSRGANGVHDGPFATISYQGRLVLLALLTFPMHKRIFPSSSQAQRPLVLVAHDRLRTTQQRADLMPPQNTTAGCCGSRIFCIHSFQTPPFTPHFSSRSIPRRGAVCLWR